MGEELEKTDVCDTEPLLFSSSLEDRVDVSFELSGEAAGLQEELVPDWISQLRVENETRMSDPQYDPWQWINPTTVEYLFTVCLRLRLSYHTKYMALAIFNKFMLSHVSTLYAELKSKHREEEALRVGWEKIESNISRQIPLRVLSCVQIAAKLNSSKEALPASAVRNCLQNLGIAYTENAILRSELRILESVGWCVNSLQSPVVCLESCLALLVRRTTNTDWAAIDCVGELWELSNCILDNLYLRVNEVYGQVVAELCEWGGGADDRKRLIDRVKSDYLLMASGVIITSCVSLGGVQFGDFAAQQLEEIIGTDATALNAVAGVFLRTILDYEVIPM